METLARGHESALGPGQCESDLGSFHPTPSLSLSVHNLSLNRLWHDHDHREGSRQMKRTVKLHKEKIGTH